MNFVVKVLVAAAAAEAILAWMLLGARWGPCGPGTPFGLIGLVAHIFPGLPVAMAIGNLCGSPLSQNAALVFSQYAFWVLAALGIAKLRSW